MGSRCADAIRARGHAPHHERPDIRTQPIFVGPKSLTLIDPLREESIYVNGRRPLQEGQRGPQRRLGAPFGVAGRERSRRYVA